MPLQISPYQLGVGVDGSQFQMGPRQGRESPQNGLQGNIAASQTGTFTLNIEFPAGVLDILMVIALGAFLQPNDNTGNLTLQAVSFAAGSGIAGGSVGVTNGLALNYQPPPVLTLPKDTNSAVSLSIVAPPPLRRTLELDMMGAVANPDRFILTAQFTLVNADAVNPHAAKINFHAIGRIINGGDSI